MPDDAADLGLIEDQGGTEESGGEIEVEETEGQGEGAEETPPEGEESGEEREGEREGREDSGRPLPTQLRKAIREFVSRDPEFAKRYPRLERQLTAGLFKAGEADKLGGLPILRQAMQTLEEHGGAEGIAEMAEEVEASRTLEQGFKEGDPAVAKHWSEAYPEGFKASVGPMVEQLERLDLAAHDRAISGPMLRALDRCGVIGTIADLDAAVAGEKFEDIQKHTAALKQFLADMRQYIARVKAPDPLKGDRDKFQAEKDEFASERETAFRGDVQNTVNNQVMAFTNRLLRQELAGKKLQVGTANRLRKQINIDLQEALQAHAKNQATGYAARYTALKDARDHDRLANLISGAARQKLPIIVKKVLRDFNLGRSAAGGSRRAPGGARNTGTGSSTVAGRPKTSDVDFTRTDKAAWLGMISGHGQAWLKNGKQAKW